MGLLARDTPCAALPLRAPLSFLRFPQACKRAGGGGGAPKWRGETCSLGGGACLQTGGGGHRPLCLPGMRAKGEGVRAAGRAEAGGRGAGGGKAGGGGGGPGGGAGS